jgi:hypothetical protein
MDLKDIAQFIKDNWPMALVIAGVVTPPIFLVNRFLFQHHVDKITSDLDRKTTELETVKTAAKDRLLQTQQELEKTVGEIDTLRKSISNKPYRGVLNGSTRCFPRVTPESEKDLCSRIENAQIQIRIFGLTRNFYASDKMRELIAKKATEVPVKFFVMDPDCESRKDRYRVEPIDAALEDPNKYKQRIEPVFIDLVRHGPVSIPLSNKPGISFYYFNFPCQFSIDQFDNVFRVSFYGLNKQGRESPIWLYEKDDGGPSNEYEYFLSQLDWVESLAAGKPSPQAKAHNLMVRSMMGAKQKPF